MASEHPPSNIAITAAQIAAGGTIEPGIRRELQLLALDHAWAARRPSDGSPRQAFDRALLELEGYARQRLAVPAALFERWAAALQFEAAG